MGPYNRCVLGSEHPDTLRSISGLAAALNWEGRLPEAEKLDREGLSGRRRVLGPEHPDTLWSMLGLSGILEQEGHSAEAEELQREGLDIEGRVLAPEHPDTLMSYMVSLATTHDGRPLCRGGEVASQDGRD